MTLTKLYHLFYWIRTQFKLIANKTDWTFDTGG